MFQHPPQVTLLTHAYSPSPLLPSPLLSPHPPRPLRLFPLSPSPSRYRPFSGPSPSLPFSSFCYFGFDGLQSPHHPSATNQSSSQYLRTTSEDLADTLSLSVNNVFIHFKNFPTTKSQSSTASTRLLPFLVAGFHHRDTPCCRFQAPTLNPSHCLQSFQRHSVSLLRSEVIQRNGTWKSNRRPEDCL